MIVNGRQAADGQGTTELVKLAARRGEELGAGNGTTNLAFGMMSEQDWQAYKETAADGAAKSEAYAQAGDARWDAWARENAVLAWLSAPDAAQRSIPADTLAPLPQDATPIAQTTPSPDAPAGAAVAVDAASRPEAARGLANLQRFHARTQDLVAQGVDPAHASLRAQIENQLGVIGGPAADAQAVAAATTAGMSEPAATPAQQLLDELAISLRYSGVLAPRDVA